MININMEIKDFWKNYKRKNLNLWIKGYIYSHSVDNIIKIIKSIQENEISNFVSTLDGHFALIVQRHDLTFIAVDKIRSTPVFFIKEKNNFFIDSDPKKLVNRSEFKKIIDENARLEISMAGFTIGRKSIYKNLKSLKAGEIVIFKNNQYRYCHYYKYFGKIVYKSFNEYLEELSNVTINIFKKMLKNIGNRQIIVPLSAGYDSRLVLSILKYLGAKNVKCYSYGKNGNFEAKIAKKVAKKLGFEWKFIPLNHKSEKKYYSSHDYNKYLDFCESYSSVPYVQSLSTIKYLKELDWIDKDCIFINGNSGDFISGGHIKLQNNFKGLNKNLKPGSRKQIILDQLIEKHFSLWGYLKDKPNIDKVKKNLWNEIKAISRGPREEFRDHLLYEYSELIDRQSKYVISKQKVYEFYGYQWRLPLWDDEYLFFWQKIPLQYKLNQNLYKEMLKYKNYGKVWGKDYLLNKKTISPKWIIPLRFIFKVLFSLFGKAGKKTWKQFDINFFKYFMNNGHTWNTVSYFRIIKDFFKKPKHSVSWQSEDYLSKKQI